MAEREYKIVYTVDESQALRAMENMTRALQAFDKLVDQVGAKLTTMPKQLQAQGVTVAAGQMNSALNQILSNATNARAALAAVGSNTSNMGTASAKAATLAANLATVTANASAAGPAVAGVGAGMRGGAGGGSGGGGGFLADIGMGVARRTAFAGFRAAARSATAGAQERKEYLETAVKRFNDFRQELQEVANLTGQPTVNDKVINEQLAFQKQTGMSADESINFREQFLGAVGAAKLRGNITDDVADKFQVSAAQFGLRYNLDPASTGKLAGLLGEYGNIPSAEAGSAKLAEVAHHLNVLGVGQVKSMIPALIGLQGGMVQEGGGGRFANVENLAARFAATTIRANSPSVAATQIKQASRALRRFGDEDVEGSTGHTLKSLGITPEMDYETALKAIAPKITGPGGDIWLAQHGFGNSTERESLRKQAELISVVEAQLGKTDPTQAAAIAKVRQGAAGANAGYLGTDIGKQRSAEVDAFATEIGYGKKQSRFELARLEAETRLRKRGEIGTPISNIAEGLQDWANIGQRSGRDDRIEAEMYNQLMRERGVTEEQIAAKFPEFKSIYTPGFMNVSDQYARLNAGPVERGELFEKVDAAFPAGRNGGGAGGAARDDLKKAAQLLNQAADKMKPAAPVAGGPPPGFVGGRP